MSDLHAGEWIALRSSSLKRRLQQAAASITALVAAVFLFIGIFDFSPLLICAGLLNAAVAGWIFFISKSLETLEDLSAIRIDGDGVVWLRNTSVASTPVFVSSGLVVLKTSKVCKPIWCDALPTDAFRQLVVAARWSRRLEPFTNPLPRV